MNKHFKIVTINGIRGLLTLIFIVFGLISGFIVAPGWVCMHIWNMIFEDYPAVSVMNIYQGIILWCIIALSLYALNDKKVLIELGSCQGLSPEEINDIVVKSQLSDPDIIKNLENVNKKIEKEIDKSIKTENEEIKTAGGIDCGKENIPNDKKENSGR